jgi:MFS family permease
MVSRAALPMTAALVLQATPAEVALLTGLDMAPGLAIGLFAGAWADRVRRKPLLIAADIGRALVLCCVPLAALTRGLHITHLYAVALATGVLTTVFDVAYGAYLPTLVGPRHLAESNAKLSASASAAEVGAFGIGGWLVQWFGGPLAVLLDAGSFLASAAFLALIRRPEPAPGSAAPGEGGEGEGSEGEGSEGKPAAAGLRAEIAEGLRVVAHDSVLRPLALGEALLSFSFRILGTLYILFVTRELQVSPGVQGMVYAVGGLTALSGALVAGPITRRLGPGYTMALGAFAAGLGVVALPIAPAASWVTVALMVASQCVTDPGYALFEINQKSMRQAATPNRLRGRVEATFRSMSVVAQIAGVATAGALGEAIGMRATILIGALGATLAALPLLSPAIRRAAV